MNQCCGTCVAGKAMGINEQAAKMTCYIIDPLLKKSFTYALSGLGVGSAMGVMYNNLFSHDHKLKDINQISVHVGSGAGDSFIINAQQGSTLIVGFNNSKTDQLVFKLKLVDQNMRPVANIEQITELSSKQIYLHELNGISAQNSNDTDLYMITSIYNHQVILIGSYADFNVTNVVTLVEA